jgi:tRNA U34 5-methylaminomethyl-2-thiouridine-forming methyltransferase MnmC
MLYYFCDLNNYTLPEIVKTEDGSHTLFVPGMNEHYHSIHGAVQESAYIFIECGYRFCKDDTISIYEVGFGTGLNALLTAVDACSGRKAVNYTSAEKYPISSSVAASLNHHEYAGPEGSKLYSAIHSAEWGKMVNICHNFNLMKIMTDLTTDDISGMYNLIYFDAFGPDKQPEMWTRSIFEKISAATAPGGILVTYSAKGEVKRMLQACGFEVFLLPGPPGKRQIIRAIKN